MSVLALTFSPDRRTLAVARHGTIVVLDASAGATLRVFCNEPEGSTFALVFSSDGLAVWRSDDGTCVRFDYLAEQKPEVYSVAVSPDQRWLAAATSRIATVFELAQR